jgi:hypothetical protein
MDWTPTLALAGAALAIGLFSGWRGAQPSDPKRGVRLVPWRPIMLLAATLFVLLVVHMVNLAGIKPN